MDSPQDTKAPWNASAVAKARNAVQRAVASLVDTLVPEKMLGREQKPADAVERYRTPTGCVLQGPDAAVSVSWFADATDDVSFGELHVLRWEGRVARRGAASPAQSAKVVSDVVYHPEEATRESCLWRTAGAEPCDSAALAAMCLAMLQG